MKFWEIILVGFFVSVCLMACDEYENHDSSLEGVQPTSLVNSQISYGKPEWIVSLHTPNGIGIDNYKCVGSLINENWVLTAAHCVFDPDPNAPELGSCAITLDPDDIEIYVADYDLTTGDEAAKIFGSEIILHDDWGGCGFDTDAYKNDIALIKLEYSASDFETVAIANSPIAPGVNKRPKDAPILGWGFYNVTDAASYGEAEELRVQIFDGRKRKTCNQAPTADIFRNLTNRELCVGDEDYDFEASPWTPGMGTAMCHGDSGGPFLGFRLYSSPDDVDDWIDLGQNNIVFPDYGEFYVRGIVSWGKSVVFCSSTYGVLQDVGAYRSWISTAVYPDEVKFVEEMPAP